MDLWLLITILCESYICGWMQSSGKYDTKHSFTSINTGRTVKEPTKDNFITSTENCVSINVK